MCSKINDKRLKRSNVATPVPSYYGTFEEIYRKNVYIIWHIYTFLPVRIITTYTSNRKKKKRFIIISFKLKWQFPPAYSLRGAPRL